jgi:hypothetical protein
MLNRENQFKLIYKPSSISQEEWEKQWLKMRMGRFGGSQSYRLLSKDKKKGFGSYVREKVAEIVTGDREDVYTNQYIEHGQTWEPAALKEYMKRNNTILKKHTYVTIGEHVGISSDGIDPINKIVTESKCPQFKTHLKYLMFEDNQDLLRDSKAYYTQVQLNMWALNFEACDFITYYSPSYLDYPVTHYKQVRIQRDQKFIDNLINCLELAIEYKLELLHKIGFIK